MLNLLPHDLDAFLSLRRKLTFDSLLAITGRVSLLPKDQLRIGNAYCAAGSRNDPNFGRVGVYRVPAVSLLKKCEKYDPDYLLCFLPYEGRFAAMDGDHASVTVFTKATWTDISNDPVPYLNALWEKKPAVPVARSTRWWQTYRFHENSRD
jgi:hypothetical protein